MQNPKHIFMLAKILMLGASEGTVYDSNIIVFSNLQKHSMNFKFSYKWFLFMPNEHFARDSSQVEAERGK